MSDNAQHALHLIDKLLEERPTRVGDDFSAATRCITAFRDELISQWRRTSDAADRQRLEQVNAVLSVVLGGHYPVGKIPWPEIEKARALFAGVVRDGPAENAPSSATA